MSTSIADINQEIRAYLQDITAAAPQLSIQESRIARDIECLTRPSGVWPLKSAYRIDQHY